MNTPAGACGEKSSRRPGHVPRAETGSGLAGRRHRPVATLPAPASPGTRGTQRARGQLFRGRRPRIPRQMLAGPQSLQVFRTLEAEN